MIHTERASANTAIRMFSCTIEINEAKFQRRNRMDVYVCVRPMAMLAAWPSALRYLVMALDVCVVNLKIAFASGRDHFACGSTRWPGVDERLNYCYDTCT